MSEDITTETFETIEGGSKTVVKTMRLEPPEYEYERRLAELMQKPKDAWTALDDREAEFLIRALSL